MTYLRKNGAVSELRFFNLSGKPGFYHFRTEKASTLTNNEGADFFVFSLNKSVNIPLFLIDKHHS